MRVVVVAGSPAARRPYRFALLQDDIVIAADLGAEHALRWGWRVDLLVGDLDSLAPDTVSLLVSEGTRVERVPAAKDQTDTELAVARALEMGARELVICGALGGRTDHLLANVLLLAKPTLARIEARLLDGDEELRLLQAEGAAAELELQGEANDLLSLLPEGASAEGVTTVGLRYPLRDEMLRLGEARGISNVFTGTRARISLRRGSLLVIHNRMDTK